MAIYNKIDVNEAEGFHRVVALMPEFAKEYGLWVIRGSIANCTVPGDFKHRKLRTFNFYSLSQMYDGRGKLELNGVVREVKPGNMILICPGEYHRYGGSDGDSYIEDSICFCGNIADILRKRGVLRSGLYHGNPTRRLKPLVELLHNPSLNNELRIMLLLQELLVDIFDRQCDENKPLEELLTTIRQAPAKYWWNVTELAELIGVSTNTLRREFLQVTGLLPKAYIEQFKLRQAAEMLLSDDSPVSKIAAHFGYRDCYHFSRRFKFLFGLSPSHYRKVMC